MNVISVLLSAALVTQPQGSPRISLAPADEAGERLIVSGRVVGPDGKTPVANASLYVYQTDKDGSYPDTQNPAHIHYVVKATGYREKIFEIVFENDPLVSESIRAAAAREDSGFSIRALTRDAQGVLRCTQDIRLKN